MPYAISCWPRWGSPVNFWAWALLGPLGPGVKERLGLSFAAQSLLVAVPVVVGSLGRIPVGALTDRYGARIMFPIVSLATIVPVLTLTVVSSYPALIITGSSSAWAAPRSPSASRWCRAGTRRPARVSPSACSASAWAAPPSPTSPPSGSPTPTGRHAVRGRRHRAGRVRRVAFLLIRDAPGRPRPPAASPGLEVARLRLTWQLCFLYAVGFGGFVAFSVYLPAYLRTAYGLAASDAALRTAGFVVLAVIARPVGGWLSDRFTRCRYWSPASPASRRSPSSRRSRRPLMPVATIAFLSMATLLGAASGAVFALVGKVAPAEKVGAVTGVVGAAGGLGGFVPPLIMGAVYGVEGSYAIGLMLLSDVALAAAVYTAVKMSGVARPGRPPPDCPLWIISTSGTGGGIW